MSLDDSAAAAGPPDAPAAPPLCAVLFPPAEAFPRAPPPRRPNGAAPTAPAPAPAAPAPAARVVHPRGFRVMKGTSAVERSLRSYFRLPPAPSARLAEERRRVARALRDAEVREEKDTSCFLDDAAQPRVLLDGFMLLCAAGAEEPDAVTAVTLQCSRLVGVIEDDLTFFTGLHFLDVSENSLRVEQLLRLTGLEVLHMTYNGIDSLAGIRRAAQAQARAQLTSPIVEASPNATGNASVRSAAAYYAQEQTQSSAHDESMDTAKEQTEEDECVHGAQSIPLQEESLPEMGDRVQSTSGYYSPHARPLHCQAPVTELSKHDVLLPHLHALNLSFNYIPPKDILHLSYFPFLEKLDLSGNGLRTLPEDLAELTCVTHLALERNKLSNGAAVFAALSTMPALIEVNLNHNRISRVPPLSVRDGRGLCFPTIEVIGLTHNRVETVQDVAALAELVRTLQRVVLSGNPIAHKAKERAAVEEHFAHAVLGLYWEQAGLRKTPYNYTQTSTNWSTQMDTNTKWKDNEMDSSMKQKENVMGTSFVQNLSATLDTNSDEESSLRVDEVNRWNHIFQLLRTQQRKQQQQEQQQEQQKKQQKQEKPQEENRNVILSGSHASRGEVEGVALSSVSSLGQSLWSRQQTELYHDESEDYEGKSGIRDASVVNDFFENNNESFNDEHVFLEALLDASALDVSTQDVSQTRDASWYNRESPLPIYRDDAAFTNKSQQPRTASRSGNESIGSGHNRETTFPKLPTPSLLRFVDVVFEEVVMQKQTTGYFYANRRQLAAETEFPRASSMIHPRTGFVTVPNYNDFMDIYKSLDKSQQPLRSGKRRKYNRLRPLSKIIVTPETKEEEEEEEEEEKEKEAEGEQRKQGSSGEGVSPQDVVFMTGVALEGEPKCNPEESKKHSPKPRVAVSVKENEVKSEPREIKNLARPKIPDKSQKPKFQRKVVSVHRPPDTNVRILMNELRTMLRRPLPPLPAAAIRPQEKAKQ